MSRSPQLAGPSRSRLNFRLYMCWPHMSPELTFQTPLALLYNLPYTFRPERVATDRWVNISTRKVIFADRDIDKIETVVYRSPRQLDASANYCSPMLFSFRF